MANKRRACINCKDLIKQFYDCNECGDRLDSNGYSVVFINGRWIKEYRYLMKIYLESLGIKLKKGQIIHHIDHDKTNSKIENLIVCKDAIEHSWVDHVLRDNAVCIKDGKCVELKYKISKDRKLIIEEA